MLETLPWGVVVLDAHGTVLRLNQLAAHWWGVPQPDLLGKPVGQLPGGTLPGDLQQALQQVTSSPQPLSEFFLPHHQQWITMATAQQADAWVVYWQDITAQKEGEQQHQVQQTASDTLLRRTEAVAHTGSYELELATGYLHFSDGLFRLFGEKPGAFTPSSSFIDSRSHPDDIQLIEQVLTQAIAGRQPYSYRRRIYHPDGHLRLLEAHGRVECDAAGQPVKLLGLIQDITERQQAAEELLQVKDELTQRATDSYAALYNSMDEGFCVLEVLFDEAQRPVDYRFLDVNPAFEKHTGLRVALGQTMNELVPASAPFAADLYGRVARTGEPTRFEGYAESVHRWFDVNAFAVGFPPDQHVAVLFSDITARKQTEQALRESDDRLRQAIGLAHLGICTWDYRQDVMWGNDERFLMLGLDPAQGVLPVAQAIALTHPEDRDATWSGIRQQVEAHGEFQADYRIVRPDDGAVRWLSEVGRVVEWERKKPVRVSSVLLDVTAHHEAAEALRQSEEQFRLLVTATSDTVYRVSADWTRMELLIGKDFLADALRPTPTWSEEYIPATDRPRVQAAIAEAIGRKLPFELEHRVRRVDGTEGWTHSRAIPVLDAQGRLTSWLGAASDVSVRKQAEQVLLEFNAGLEQQVAERTRALGDSQDRLQSVFNSSTNAVMLLQAVRDAEGRILDFEYVLVNPVTQAYHRGQSLIGQRHNELHPGALSTGIFEQFKAVVETGRRADFEVYYNHEGYNHWFRLVGVKLNDGLLYSAEDITARKLLEQAQIKSLTLLQESEAVAGMGSWDYDLGTRVLTWSDGLYRLLGRPVGSTVSLQHFLDAVLDDDRGTAARLLRIIGAGTSNFDARLRLRVGDAVRTVDFKAVLLPAAPGTPERVLGVCLDVSDVERLEAENLALKLDRHKELLLAILQAQENERQRLAEVLHNGLGQVLYATKLHLDQLDTPALQALPALAGLHQQTARLLADAMHQTRTLAHELVPTSLTEFGLAAAVRDVCRDLSTPQLRVDCQIWGEERELPAPIQVTLFRLAQELAHNIVRHAGATQATLELETLPNWVSLRAEDNGHGFDTQTAAEGLGLRTVRDAVALLGGTVAIDSSPNSARTSVCAFPCPYFPSYDSRFYRRRPRPDPRRPPHAAHRQSPL
ncbi:PAS domain-containing sensor histidine kinase [Hymenobacter volaticus]|uniref:histidine kinase n=1 Tax=Hymenobacter volaticus TaxID=2932254 RepID=A0ABY4GEM1_9BACT|nr:PAS domain-containing protein [Hymenobacter volaticus]UOQ69360.1 PAS domain-containing protein [Hymenobacter volaticus]